MTSSTSQVLRVAELSVHKPTPFELEFTSQSLKELAKNLDIPAIKKLRFAGQIAASGGADWKLSADLGATVVQDCVVTLEPVTTRIDENVTRHYLATMPDIDGAEIEMPEDDSFEETPDSIDLVSVLKEALALAVPAFPRKPDAELGEAVFTQPGQDAMTDEDAKPFAGLEALRDSLKNKGDENPS